MACWISSSTTSNWILTAIPYSCSVERGLTGSKQSITREILYKRYENGRLQWPRTGEEAKQISDQQLRWLLEGLNPEQPKAVQKWLPHKSENTENP